MKTYRKKPIIVRSAEFDGTLTSVEDLEIPYVSQDLGSNTLQIETLEGVMTAQPGDFIVRGVRGEFYPVKPDIFWATYEEIERPYTTEEFNKAGEEAERYLKLFEDV